MVNTWRAWWLGDMAGDLLVAPLLLAWTGERSERAPEQARRVVEALLLAGLVMVATTGVFFAPERGAGLAYTYVVFPPLIWAGLRFHQRGATLAGAFVSLVGVAATAAGHGPFVVERLAESLQHLQAFMAIMAVTALLLAAAASERERATAARDQMLAIVSHDLRSPLTTAQLSASILARPQSDEKTRLNAERVLAATDRMESLLSNLLDLAALEAGRLELRSERLDAGALALEAIDLQRPIAATRAQTIDCQAGPLALHVLADRERTLQILSNLIGNAVKFAPGSSAIAIRLAPDADYVRFSVADRGPGMSREQLPHVFERFWRASRSKEGLGLGLSIAREIVEAQGGRIWVESSPGAGSTFFFTLPRAGDSPEPASEPVTA
jgi:signal transduction histidine kinase